MFLFDLMELMYTFSGKDHTEDTSLIHRSQPLPPMQKNSNWFDKFLTSLAGKSFPSTKKVKQLTPANWDRRTNTSTLWFPLMHTSTSFWQGLRLLSNGHTSFFIPSAVDSCRRITVFFPVEFPSHVHQISYLTWHLRHFNHLVKHRVAIHVGMVLQFC